MDNRSIFKSWPVAIMTAVNKVTVKVFEKSVTLDPANWFNAAVSYDVSSGINVYVDGKMTLETTKGSTEEISDFCQSTDTIGSKLTGFSLTCVTVFDRTHTVDGVARYHNGYFVM